MKYVSFNINTFFQSHIIFVVCRFLRKLCQMNSKIRKTMKRIDKIQTGRKPIVIIVPLRLGSNNVNTEYIDQIKITGAVG